MRAVWLKNSQDIAGHKRAHRNANKVFSLTLSLLHGSDWRGACHASSLITHIALRELGTENKLVLGEAAIGPAYFDHSWIEVDSSVIDSAISLPLNPMYSAPPVFLGVDLETRLPTDVVYRAFTSELDEETLGVANNDIGWYFDNFDLNSRSFFEPLTIVLRDVGIRATEQEIRQKYSKSGWHKKI